MKQGRPTGTNPLYLPESEGAKVAEEVQDNAYESRRRGQSSLALLGAERGNSSSYQVQKPEAEVGEETPSPESPSYLSYSILAIKQALFIPPHSNPNC